MNNPVDLGEEASLNDNKRFATFHTPVLSENMRKTTDLRTGLIDWDEALDWCDDSFGMLGDNVVSRHTLRLGSEQPFYEVAFRGNVYRMLARPIPDQVREKWGTEKRELIRCSAAGMRVGGILLEPPAAAPNTPLSLVLELVNVIGASAEEVIAEGYSVYHYRTKNRNAYPESLTPIGYTLSEQLLMYVDDNGTLQCLYETPPGTNVELWTHFLTVLDAGPLMPLSRYVNSPYAYREFGDKGSTAMKKAFQIREPGWEPEPNERFTRFGEVFPPPLGPGKRVPQAKRAVGTKASLY